MFDLSITNDFGHTQITSNAAPFTVVASGTVTTKPYSNPGAHFVEIPLPPDAVVAVIDLMDVYVCPLFLVHEGQRYLQVATPNAATFKYYAFAPRPLVDGSGNFGLKLFGPNTELTYNSNSKVMRVHFAEAFLTYSKGYLPVSGRKYAGAFTLLRYFYIGNDMFTGSMHDAYKLTASHIYRGVMQDVLGVGVYWSDQAQDIQAMDNLTQPPPFLVLDVTGY